MDDAVQGDTPRVDAAHLGTPENESEPGRRHASDLLERLGDFTTSPAVFRLLPLAVVIGILGAFIALFLLALIGFITNALYYQRLNLILVSPLRNTLGLVAVLIPVVGGLVVGVMARYGSERIRGHGIPEAMETILVGGSKVKPRLTVLKPVSSAVAIGTGGPFGAEGPIIMTGGAVGSVLAQFFRLSAMERRILLVAGAAAGMSAVFGTPIAATLLGVELLLFEWKPRSLVPVAIASAVADAIRREFAAAGWVNAVPLFPINTTPLSSAPDLLEACVVGIACGAGAWLLTRAVYATEDAFRELPLHWMWWPALGGLAVGIGGLIEPRALGVGYDTIADVLAGNLGITALVSVFVVKLLIWAIALGSGTSGGILAPILMMGAAMGGLLGAAFPGGIQTDWAFLGMTGLLAGVMRSPFTAIVFGLELTYSTDLFLPLLITTMLAHLISVVILKRSILTEKVARRGFHVLREYTVEPLEALFARDVMSTNVLTLESGVSLEAANERLRSHAGMRHQRLLPVVTEDGHLAGAISWQDVLQQTASGEAGEPVDRHMHTHVVTAFPDESLRAIADRMALREVGVLPIVQREPSGRFCGLITQFELLKARGRILEEERDRERILHWSRLSRRGTHEEITTMEVEEPEER